MDPGITKGQRGGSYVPDSAARRVRRLRDPTGVAMTTGVVLDTWSSGGLVGVKRDFYVLTSGTRASLQPGMRSCHGVASISRNPGQRTDFFSSGRSPVSKENQGTVPPFTRHRAPFFHQCLEMLIRCSRCRGWLIVASFEGAGVLGVAAVVGLSPFSPKDTRVIFDRVRSCSKLFLMLLMTIGDVFHRRESR